MLTLLLHSLCIVLHFLPAPASATPPLAPALYVFGDSLLDSGNNNLLPTLAKANYEPYGVDFARGRATGRFTNGRNTGDFIAEYLGLPYPPPALGSPRRDWLTGFNYASGSCGILDQTGSTLGKCLNLEDQINLFEGTVKNVIGIRYTNPEELASYMSKSIFVFSVGNNDYMIEYLNPLSAMRRRFNPQQFADYLIAQLSQKLQKLYELGARKVLVFELGAIGCVPFIAKTTTHNGQQCNEETNDIVSLYNDALQSLLSSLTSKLTGSHFIMGHVHGLSYDAIINPSKYGLTNTRDACCVTLLNGIASCKPLLPPCPNHNQNYFWDAFHPTEAVSSVVASQCINGSSICKPYNIQQLVQL